MIYSVFNKNKTASSVKSAKLLNLFKRHRKVAIAVRVNSFYLCHFALGHQYCEENFLKV